MFTNNSFMSKSIWFMLNIRYLSYHTKYNIFTNTKHKTYHQYRITKQFIKQKRRQINVVFCYTCLFNHYKL